MKLVILHGPPACGKLTVARELAALTGWRLFHNHQAIDLVLSLFAFGTPSFVTLRDRVWMAAFEEACAAGLEAMIFTYAQEPSVPADFLPRVKTLVEGAGGEVVLVELTAPLKVLESRIGDPSRKPFGKITDLALFRELWAKDLWSEASMSPSRLTVDTQANLPAQAARMIADAVA